MPARFRAARLALAAAVSVLVLLNGWVDEDAFIAFRTIDNFAQGYGLRFNVDERVQAYTHPLWMFAVAGLYSLTGEFSFSVLALSTLLAFVTAAVVLFGVERTPQGLALAAVVLAFSKAHVHWSTSGLENVLTHLLFACFMTAFLRSRDFRPATILLLSFLASLSILNRQDVALLLLPALGGAAMRGRSSRALVALGGGLLPVLAWELFSLLYYGFPFPNTAYAKLFPGISRAELAAQGGWYFASSLALDPVTILALALAIGLSAWARCSRLLLLGAGALAYEAYVLSIGGDYMSGRFLSAPAVFAALALGRVRIGAAAGFALAAIVALVALASPYPTVSPPLLRAETPPRLPLIDSHGIADKQRTFYPWTGFWTSLHRFEWPLPPVRRGHLERRIVSFRYALNDSLLRTPYEEHVSDDLGIVDPLLARLPVTPPWRIGHFRRRIPAGYASTLHQGRNRLCDPSLAELYDRIALVTRGPLFDRRRLVEIVRLNFRPGGWPAPVSEESRREAEEAARPVRSVDDPDFCSRAIDAPLSVVFPAVQHARRIRLWIEDGDDQEVRLWRGDKLVWSGTIRWTAPRPRTGNDLEFVEHAIELPPAASRTGFDRVLVMPPRDTNLGPDGQYVLGALRLD
ncbi:MAG: hypothetical protein ACREQ9_24295 [Candidatus Binatia bacterium]